MVLNLRNIVLITFLSLLSYQAFPMNRNLYDKKLNKIIEKELELKNYSVEKIIFSEIKTAHSFLN